MKPLFQEIAGRLSAIENCKKTGNKEWQDRHEELMLASVQQFMPHGSGIDAGTKLDTESSNPDRLVFTFGYHHMDENGYYDGWTEHKCIVTPSLQFRINIRITGKNRNDIKDYLYDVFDYALRQDV